MGEPITVLAFLAVMSMELIAIRLGATRELRDGSAIASLLFLITLGIMVFHYTGELLQ